MLTPLIGIRCLLFEYHVYELIMSYIGRNMAMMSTRPNSRHGLLNSNSSIMHKAVLVIRRAQQTCLRPFPRLSSLLPHLRLEGNYPIEDVWW